MTRPLSFMPRAWTDYLYWQSHDKKMMKRINELLKDINRNPFTGIGQPEPLKHNLNGLWSRRIDGTHRIVYEVSDLQILIVSCRYHYNDK
ncbi:MAG: Txe/YoeB family addiction module toxin [Defluviitaleaceae bacterium]|nr:Txe/YoeB family addiction module toxin [Defluviitaleaceae bacterium]